MKERKTAKIVIICGLIFLFLYIILAARPLGQELFFEPHWSISADSALNQEADRTEPGIPFVTADTAGYVSASGQILLKRPFDYKVAISNTYCADYQASVTSTPVYDTAGNQVCVLQTSGFPFFQDDRIFVFLPGGNSVARYATDGSRTWLYEGYTPITAFQSTDNNVIIGFADGNITCLDASGEKLFSYYPGGSDLQAIFGAAVSHSGKLTACVSGINRQRIILTSLVGGQNKIVFHAYLNGNFREQTLVQFSRDDSTVYFNDKTGLGILNCTNYSLAHIPLNGKIISIQEMPENNVTAVFAQNGKKFSVYFIEKHTQLIGSFSFNADNAFLTGEGKSLYINKNNTISKLTVRRR